VSMEGHTVVCVRAGGCAESLVCVVDRCTGRGQEGEGNLEASPQNCIGNIWYTNRVPMLHAYRRQEYVAT